MKKIIASLLILFTLITQFLPFFTLPVKASALPTLDWIERMNVGPNNFLLAINWSDFQNKFIITGTIQNNFYYITSPNGRNWTRQPNMPQGSNAIMSLLRNHDNTNSFAIKLNTLTSKSNLFSSNNEIDWSLISTPFPDDQSIMNHLIKTNNPNKFYLFYFSNLTRNNYVSKSIDGSNWTTPARISGLHNILLTNIVEKNNKLIATGFHLITGSNSIIENNQTDRTTNWSQSNIPHNTEKIFALTWIGGLFNRFMTIGIAPRTNLVSTLDGNHWTLYNNLLIGTNIFWNSENNILIKIDANYNKIFTADTPFVQNIPVTDLVPDRSLYSKVIEINEKYILPNVLVLPINATNKEIKWTATTPGIVEIKKVNNPLFMDQIFKIKGLKQGSTFLSVNSVSNPNIKLNEIIEIIVNDPTPPNFIPVTEIIVYPPQNQFITLDINETFNLPRVEVLPINATNKEILWHPNTPDIVKIEEIIKGFPKKGHRIRALKHGSTSISIYSISNNNINIHALITVNVTDQTYIPPQPPAPIPIPPIISPTEKQINFNIFNFLKGTPIPFLDLFADILNNLSNSVFTFTRDTFKNLRNQLTAKAPFSWIIEINNIILNNIQNRPHTSKNVFDINITIPTLVSQNNPTGTFPLMSISKTNSWGGGVISNFFNQIREISMYVTHLLGILIAISFSMKFLNLEDKITFRSPEDKK